MSTQRERAADAVGKMNSAIESAVAPMRGALAELRDVLERAQNRPPAGEADGTIDEPLWLRLRDYANAVDSVLQGFEAYIGSGRPS